MTSPRLIIEGGRPLQGRVRIGTSKNAALYALPACLLTSEEVILEGVPEIEDTRVMADILVSLGCDVRKMEHGVWHIRAANVSRYDAPNDLVVNQRASFLVMGPLLARFGQAACCFPGGDVLGSRPLDVHIDGFRALGAEVERKGEVYEARMPHEGLHPTGARVFLDYPSVMGTVNIIFAAVLAEGHTTVINAASEPEIMSLIDMLKGMGAQITCPGSGMLEIDGVHELGGVRHRVLPERLEAALFALSAAATRGDVIIEGAIPEHMDALLSKLRAAGAGVEIQEGSIRISGEGRTFQSVQAQAVPYPGLATDMHPPLAAFLTQCSGVSVIHERVYDNRLLYISELRKMGADVITAGQTALITGPTKLYSANVKALDIRAGGALVLAALVAEGRTEITDVYHLDRAHEDLVGKLRGLGATVER